MSIHALSKVGALSLLSVSIIACSSSNDSPSTAPTTVVKPTDSTKPEPVKPADPTKPVVFGDKDLIVPFVSGNEIIRGVSGKGVASNGKLQSANTYKEGFSNQGYNEQTGNAVARGRERVYNQPNSIVYGNAYYYLTDSTGKNVIVDESHWSGRKFAIEQIRGTATEKNQIPAKGKATYYGQAFSSQNESNFKYTINFETKSGSGVIDRLDDFNSSITLREAPLDTAGKIKIKEKEVFGIQGVAGYDSSSYDWYDGTYYLGLFGKNADEVAGYATFSRTNNTYEVPGSSRTEIGFAGKKAD